MTFVKPTNGNRPCRLDDDWITKTKATLNITWTGSTWITKTKATLNITWTGSTNFEEQSSYKDERLEKMNNNKQPQQEDSKVRISQHHKNAT